MKRLRAEPEGFSLFETLAVVIALGIISAVALGTITSSTNQRRRAETEREMEMLARAIAGNPALSQGGERSHFGYVGDIGGFPPSLDALTDNPGGYTTWDGPYLPRLFGRDTLDHKIDAWGEPYMYSGGITITSTGSGTTIVRKLAGAAGDCLYNTLTGSIADAVNSVPGAIFKDSIDIIITVPDGLGGRLIKYCHPDSSGAFGLDSLPIGRHPIRFVYTPHQDTLRRYVTILPRHRSGISYRFASSYFGSAGASPGIETLRPDGIGSTTQLSSSGCAENWQCLDETAADGDVTHLYEAAAGFSSETCSTSDHNSGSGMIDSVRLFVNCIGYGGNSRVMTRILTAGGSQNGAMEKISTTVYTVYTTTYTVNPVTGSPWNWSQIDDMEIGLRLRAGRCTQVWAEVYYTP